MPAPEDRGRRLPVLAVVAIGLGLAVAPFVFQMFARAPMGGEMMASFRPLMTAERLDAFGDHLDRIDAAADAVGPVDASAYPATAEFAQRWPQMGGDMGEMLATIVDNLDNFAAVDALPPFDLFPWFFVIPGLLAAGLGLAALRGPSARWPRLALVALGLGLVAAPLVFQMFSRAPLGAEMIEDFGPVMTAERIAESQQAFLLVAGAEAELRRSWIPAQESPPEAVVEFVAAWPRTAADMAPMIGAMADNLESFAAVEALPPFDLFPWFFLIPGLLVTGLAGVSLLRKEPAVPARATALVAVLVFSAAACQQDDPAPDPPGVAPETGELSGLLAVEDGACGEAGVTEGSWFRMVQPGGDPEDGPFVANGDSPCGDQTWTPVAVGADGGLRLGEHQPHPDPAFTEEGHGANASLLAPTAFFAVDFAVATNPVDQQTGLEAPPPSLEADGGTLSGDLSAFGVAWNGQHFNQGAPKPDGDTPGLTMLPTGTLDPDTGRFTLRWASQIVGGPFDNFTGLWHLEGELVP